MDLVATDSLSVMPTDPQGRFGAPGRRDVAPLPRVEARLERATGGVAVVRAPAGYGKSTQVGLWSASDGRPVMWVDLGFDRQRPGTTRVAAGRDARGDFPARRR